MFTYSRGEKRNCGGSVAILWFTFKIFNNNKQLEIEIIGDTKYNTCSISDK